MKGKEPDEPLPVPEVYYWDDYVPGVKTRPMTAEELELFLELFGLPAPSCKDDGDPTMQGLE